MNRGGRRPLISNTDDQRTYFLALLIEVPSRYRAEDGLTDIRAACQTGTPLGNDAFKAKIERKLHCKVGRARRGRPKRPNKGL